GIVFGDGIDEEARGFGVFGGKPGSLNELVVTDRDGCSSRPRSKEIVRGIRRGSVVRQRAGGGGGYGNPRERPIELVVEDVRNGFVSLVKAREDYGVAIDSATLEADLEATRKLREDVGWRRRGSVTFATISPNS